MNKMETTQVMFIGFSLLIILLVIIKPIYYREVLILITIVGMFVITSLVIMEDD